MAPCVVCGKAIYRRPDKLKKMRERGVEPTCSKRCMGIYQNKRVKTQCLNCNRPITVKRRAFNRKKHGNFCSRRCCGEWQLGKAMRGPDLLRHPKMVETVCTGCGKTIEVRASNGKPASKSKYGNFCSHSCADKWLWKTSKKKAMKNMKKRVIFTCVNCGISKDVRQSTFYRKTEGKTEPTKLCSNKCRLEWAAKNHRYVSSLDRKFGAALENNGIAHRAQKHINGFVVDFFIPPNVVVECDGKYWHSLPNIVEKDTRENRVLKEAGYVMLRFREDEINKNLPSCISIVSQALSESKSH